MIPAKYAKYFYFLYIYLLYCLISQYYRHFMRNLALQYVPFLYAKLLQSCKAAKHLRHHPYRHCRNSRGRCSGHYLSFPQSQLLLQSPYIVWSIFFRKTVVTYINNIQERVKSIVPISSFSWSDSNDNNLIIRTQSSKIIRQVPTLSG